ncbi:MULTISPECIES: flavin reductase family protein [Streptomyces]|jgi:flavin reductase (DIM6/NTAB) family NADH-FMN oxidoreductase RutF|uniref:NADH-FMN oxidoreductase RutF, flavin reductase (DIM6/NTAB) family n=1 Tax=Streptomyces radiopugnans TaxID=403935 RepID=A0A1H9CVN5_9ACTN|nr:flavin reductase family protein [Streptomyces radiopugnans]SEQ05167.1 NADH-FMN oxidoreductase RutF, flavin reductase (DIM6/NTAB) family [Streptomyces radiopugnans]
MRPDSTTLTPESDIAAFRSAMGCFPTGVALLSRGSGAGASVVTVNSLTSVSLDPLLLLVCLKSDSRMVRRVSEAGSFAVNVLDETQRDLSALFARPDRPSGESAMRLLDAVEGATGNAVLPSAAAFFECRLYAEHAGGDHVVFLGRVVAMHRSTPDRRPLLFHHGRYAALA